MVVFPTLVYLLHKIMSRFKIMSKNIPRCVNQNQTEQDFGKHEMRNRFNCLHYEEKTCSYGHVGGASPSEF